MAWIVALAGKVPPGVPVGDEPEPVLVVEPPLLPPLFGGYLIPEEGQDPVSGASIGTNTPSMMEPFKLKYQLIWLIVLESQSREGVKPDCAFKAEVSCERVKVFELVGVIPALERNVKVGRVWKSLTTVWKNATASAPFTLPAGKQEGSRVLMHVPCVAHSCSQNCSFSPLISTQNSSINVKVSLAPLFVNNVLIPV